MARRLIDPSHSTHSKEAATYDTRHEKGLTQIIENIRERLDFLGVDWAEDDDGDSSASDAEGEEARKEGQSNKRPVRLLDYACGTGTISRVRWNPSPMTSTCASPVCSAGKRRPCFSVKAK
jgi:hypothetical protein